MEVGKREVMVDIDLKVVYVFNIPEIRFPVPQGVVHRLLELCGLLAREINIAVVGLEFPVRMTQCRVDGGGPGSILAVTGSLRRHVS